VIPDSVTEIGGSAFSGCKALVSVVIPDSVTEIGKWAFYGCTSLASVVIPESVTEIGEYAFRDCAALASVVIPEGVTEIGEYAFSGCTPLSSVEIPSSVTGIYDGAFYGCAALSSVVIPESVTEIGEWAFNGCNITELSHPCLTIKGGVAIKDGKVQYCASQAREIVIPEGVTEIGEYAFRGCAALASVEIPSSVTAIGVCALDDCTALASVEIPEGVTKIGVCAFSGCKALVSVVIPDSVTEIGEGAFNYCKALKTVTLADNLAKVNADWFKDLPEDCEIVCTEGSAAYKAVKRSSRLKAHVKALALETAKTEKIRQIQQVSADAFIGSLLKDKADSSFEILASTKAGTVVLVQIAENNAVFKLGADSSKWMDKAKKAAEILSDSTKSGREIYDALLKNKLPLAEIPAKKAENLTLKAGADKTVRLFCKGKVKAYGHGYVWQGWTWHSIFSRDVRSAELFGVTAIVEWAFRGYESLASVVIPESVTEIGSEAFKGCKALASVVIPESVTEIGKESFKGCNITELSHPCLTIKGGVAIKDGVAEYCASQAREIVIPDGVTEIGGYAFKGCKSLAAVEIPAGVTAIGRSAFSGCTSLASVVIPEGVTEIGDQAFGGCTALASVEFGGTVAQWEAVEKGDDWHGGVPAKSVKCADGEWQKLVVHVENGVALECLDRNATSVTIPEGVTEIGKQAFWFCESLSSVVIPSSVTEIGKQAFEGCESLSSVEFGGTMAQWKSVKKGIFAWDNDAPATTVKCSDGEARL
ncbi:leucine-rich repeat domain-containing protein, partial [Treponema saccharophilum]